MNQHRELPCPQCGKTVRWNQDFPYRPFCSQRCQLIDLGEWADEGYRIPSNTEPSPIPPTLADKK
ncbi:MAG: DNA gyrase inhibitor YacG [Cellvibrionaceae bacterium]|nr:DNA gyrase inhibitor YacG [Cellvibrionaceae bacterium]